MVSRIAVAFLVCLLAVRALGEEPAAVSLREALGHAKLAFWGRVTGADLVADHPYETISRLRLKVVECLFGSCRVGDQATLRYPAFSLAEDVVPIPFVAVGGEVLVVLNSSHSYGNTMLLRQNGKRADRLYFSDSPRVGSAISVGGERRLTQGPAPLPREWEKATMDELRTWSRER